MSEADTSAAPIHVCDGWDWRSGLARHCALRLGHKGSCSGDPCEHPIYMDGRCYDCGAPHPADCECRLAPPVCFRCGRQFTDRVPVKCPYCGYEVPDAT